ncbi:MAG TPA: hypothetical protein VHC97_01935 [Thermoanaerobaculia bacterium]|jgi:hypothetical protein|nr:hypothetical protein [Thermoanaerobaculia bacterium]
MNRSRTFAAVVLSVALLVATAPVLQARPLSQPRVSATGGEWLSAAWSWLTQTLGIQPAAPTARHEKAKPDSGTTTSDGDLGGAQTMSGSCIDPWGCTTGGGGGGGRP